LKSNGDRLLLEVFAKRTILKPQRGEGHHLKGHFFGKQLGILLKIHQTWQQRWLIRNNDSFRVVWKPRQEFLNIRWERWRFGGYARRLRAGQGRSKE
jgi:hypothetical protein